MGNIPTLISVEADLPSESPTIFASRRDRYNPAKDSCLSNVHLDSIRTKSMSFLEHKKILYKLFTVMLNEVKDVRSGCADDKRNPESDKNQVKHPLVIHVVEC